MMVRFIVVTLAIASVGSLSVNRRAFLAQHAAAAVGASGGAWLMESSVAEAYDRDVGGESRSAEQTAYNIQARETNARLERSGFKLDTKEEEASRLADALGSYSYSPSSSGKSSSDKSSSTTAKRPTAKK